MSDLRLTIEDMIACISFVDVIHVASFELVERIKHIRIRIQKAREKYAQFFLFANGSTFFFHPDSFRGRITEIHIGSK